MIKFKDDSVCLWFRIQSEFQWYIRPMTLEGRCDFLFVADLCHWSSLNHVTLEQTIPEALAVSHDCWNRLVVCCASRLQDRDFLSTFNFVAFGMLLQVLFLQ